MVYTDVQRRELTIKLVYCGPALSGKTTNLRCLHDALGGRTGTDLFSLATRGDRTLFFDLLPLRLEVQGGFRVRLKLFTVPGQVMHAATRKLVLAGADGVAFVADSQRAKTQQNNESYAEVKANLVTNGVDPATAPIVIQFNKRDLPDIRSDAEIDRIAAKGREPVFRATAIAGAGVVETFLGLARLTWARLDRHHRLHTQFGLSPDNFMERVGALFA
ncbi:MAG: gliding motility protein [Myxococcales bacterium FL481]|nr:MAG: gliding motility protein [Myxococcales bacterium FL481]